MAETAEPVFENLKRREELRKAETTTGGRKKYVSPLELFRMQLDADASQTETTTSMDGGEDGEGGSCAEVENSGEDLEVEELHANVVPPPSPDDCEADPGHRKKSSRSFTEDENCTTEAGSSERPVVYTRESWLKCMFPFKQCRQVIRSASKSLGLVDMSTTSPESFFRNPLYKNKQKISRNKLQGQVDETVISTSKTTRTKRGKSRSVESSEGSKRISAGVGCLGAEWRRSLSARRHRNSKDVYRSHEDCIVRMANFGIVQVTSQPEKIHPPRPSSALASPVANQKNCNNGGMFRRALLRSRHGADGARRAVESSSPDPCSQIGRRSLEICDTRRQQKGENGDVYLTAIPPSRRKQRPKKTGSPTIHEHPLSHLANGQDHFMSLDARRQSGCKSARNAEESNVDRGFSAFVPFQGFGAYANQGHSNRTDHTPLCRSFESQTSSVNDSRTESGDYSRNSLHSKNSDRYYSRK